MSPVEVAKRYWLVWVYIAVMVTLGVVLQVVGPR